MNLRDYSPENLTSHLLRRLREVQQNLGFDLAADDDADVRFADALDSMGMVEFLVLLAEDCVVTPEVIEERAGRQFSTVRELAKVLHGAGLAGRPGPISSGWKPSSEVASWLAATSVRLPEQVEPAASLDSALDRPSGWFESHAGIHERRIWANQDPLLAAAEAGRGCLEESGLDPAVVGGLLVTSEAPPLLLGLAAALHHRLRLPQQAFGVEIGGACTGFLAALWTAQALLARTEHVLLIAVEAASRYLQVRPGPAGEAAALFGDGAAAALLSAHRQGSGSASLHRVSLSVNGSLGHLIQIERTQENELQVRMSGVELAGQAVEVMAQSTRDLAESAGLTLTDLAAVVCHGGNGRLPGLLARKLGLAPEKVWSSTPSTGNLGSASLPVAWATHQPRPDGPVIWTAAGAGLGWGAALIEA
jgi:3-oxoacyl-[acyl-carrier-protein] synthase-3